MGNLAMAPAKDCLSKELQWDGSNSGSRKWDSLNHNLLVQIFEKLQTEELFYTASSVCRSWEIACWDVLFWKYDHLDLLDFDLSKKLGLLSDHSVLEEEEEELEMKRMRIIKSIMEGDYAYCTPAVGWSQSLDRLLMPKNFRISDRILVYMAERTQKITTIFFNELEGVTTKGFSRGISHWKEIRFMVLSSKFTSTCRRISDVFVVDEEKATAVAKNLPRLETLWLAHCCISKVGAAIIAEKCRNLELFKIERCWLALKESASSSTTHSTNQLLKKAEPRDFVKCSTANVKIRVQRIC